MPNIVISDELFARLQKHAVPLVDTTGDVIARAVDALDALKGSPAQPPDLERLFSAAAPPDLSFTTVHHASVDGSSLPPAETYWNSLLIGAIRSAVRHGLSADRISKALSVNHVIGSKQTGGYKYVPEANISIQGQDANGAWKAAYYLAREVGISLDVSFAWQQNEKAAYPGARGRLALERNMKS